MNNTPGDEQKKKVEGFVKKADNLSNFGTLTSLISTAAYFIENTFVERGKKLPKWLSIGTLSAVGVGIVSVISSYYYKLKAGRIALNSPVYREDKANTASPEAAAPAPPGISEPEENKAAAQKWAKGIANTKDPASAESMR